MPQPLTAGREGKTRERLLERTRVELDKIAASKRRASAKTLGARVGRVLERSKMGKFVRWDVIDGRLSWSFDQDKIAAENGTTCGHPLTPQLRCAPGRLRREGSGSKFLAV